MARKRHHHSMKHHGHHLSHAESERMLHDKEMKHGSHHVVHSHHPMHPRHSMKRKYDTLTHERDMFNDETHHDRLSEKSGPYHYDRQVLDNRGAYEGYKGRRHQEMMDAGMIHEDQRQIANLPQEVMIKPYPMTGTYIPEDLDDTIRGVDRQMNYDDEQKMRHFFPKKV